jgi:hypothetical protein
VKRALWVMRETLNGILIAAVGMLVVMGGGAAQAAAAEAPQKPCGKYGLVPYTAPSVDLYDIDGDGWHCSGPTVTLPYGGTGPADNVRIPGSPPGDAYLSDYYGSGKPSSVDEAGNRFSAVMGKPECDCTMLYTFAYDENDLFYVQGNGNGGSKLVSLASFEKTMSRLVGSTGPEVLAVHYDPAGRSVYSVYRW